MQRGMVVDLDAELSLDAARLAHEMKLPIANSVILATARWHRATLWSQDSDFEGIAGVRYTEKRSG